MNKTFHIFTDGSAIRNPGPGGWAAVLIHGSKSWEMSGASPWTRPLDLRISSDMQTMEVESTPPLSSARIGAPGPLRRSTDCRKSARKCSSYSWSDL